MYDRFLKLPLPNQAGELLLKKDGKLNKSLTVEAGESFSLIIHIPRLYGTLAAHLRIFRDGEKEPTFAGAFSWCDFEGAFDEYSISIKKGELNTGLFFAEICIESTVGLIYAKRTLGKVYFERESKNIPLIQLTVSSFKYEKPEKLYGGIIYHIFVDRFCRGEGAIAKEGNRIIDGEWDMIPEYPAYAGAPLKNNTFYGGNLDGIKERLPYLASLGVSTIYLSPIFDSPSNHKYDTSDYMKVDFCFGGDEALQRLIDEAKKHGIGIILDGVFNHTGDDSVYFDRYGKHGTLGAYQSKESPYYSWYDFRNYPEDYNCWWGIKILPRIHPDRKECGEYFLKKDGVIDKYRKMGIYGMRLDVADELSDNFLSGIKARLSEDGESYLLGEVWEDGSNKIAYDKRKSYYQGSELDGVMNYPLRVGIIDFLVNNKSDSLRYALTDIIYNAPKRIADSLMNLLGTHDTERILTLLSGVKCEGLTNKELSQKRLTEYEKARGIKRLLIAYTICATLPGVPSIYYGDEVGTEGFSDPFNRMPYPYGKENLKILDFYKKIGIIRRGNSIYRDGSFELLVLEDDLLVFSRTKGGKSLVTVINNSEKDIILVNDKKLASLIDGKKGSMIKISSITAAIISAPVGSSLSIYRG